MYAVIVTYNRLNYLKTTIEKSIAFGFDEIIIINNASTDGTKEFLKENYPQLTVLNLKKNIGGAGGFYEGLSYIKEKYTSGWTCLFDDDSFPETCKSQVLKRLQECAPNTGVVAAAVFLPNGDVSEMNRVGINPFKSTKDLYRAIRYGRTGFHISDENYRGNQRIKIDTSSFVGCFVNIEAIHSSGAMPRKDFFIYGDDVLFTYQISISGYQNFFDPEVRFVHDCFTYDKNAAYQSFWKLYFHYRNVLEVYKTISKGLFPLVAVRYLLIWVYKVRFYGKEKKKYLKVLGLAFRDWALNDYSKSLPDVLKEIESYDS